MSGDVWAVGDAYEQYVGRWSRRVAEVFVPWLDRCKVRSYRYRGLLSKVMLGILAVSFVWLGKIGAGTGTDPVETIIGRVLTFLYFAFFITMPIWTRLDKTKPVPERVTTHD